MDEVQAAFEAGWQARDMRAEAPQRWSTYTGPQAELLDVAGMMLEDYEDWVDRLDPHTPDESQRKPAHKRPGALSAEEARTRSMSRHPANRSGVGADGRDDEPGGA